MIDFHTHIFAPEMRADRSSFASDPGFAALYSSESSRMAGHEDLVRTLTDNAIDHAVAMSFPWEEEPHAALHNRYLLEAAAESAGKIIPFACVPRRCTDIAGFMKDLAGQEFRGVGELAFYADGFTASAGEFLRRVFSAATEHRMMVCLHLNEPIGHPYPGKYPTPFARVYALIQEFPDVTIILSHWGGGILFYELMPEVRAAFGNVYYDTAASPYIYANEVYAAALGITGPERILFGTDYPLLGPAKYLAAIGAMTISENMKQAMLDGNARRLLFPGA
ncbi:MAG: amidohydrolase [Spirochaetes bacterium]|nr:MAG: amidohydrolase [Spirochaetota bacterium]